MTLPGRDSSFHSWGMSNRYGADPIQSSLEYCRRHISRLLPKWHKKHSSTKWRGFNWTRAAEDSLLFFVSVLISASTFGCKPKSNTSIRTKARETEKYNINSWTPKKRNINAPYSSKSFAAVPFSGSDSDSNVILRLDWRLISFSYWCATLGWCWSYLCHCFNLDRWRGWFERCRIRRTAYRCAVRNFSWRPFRRLSWVSSSLISVTFILPLFLSFSLSLSLSFCVCNPAIFVPLTFASTNDAKVNFAQVASRVFATLIADWDEPVETEAKAWLDGASSIMGRDLIFYVRVCVYRVRYDWMAHGAAFRRGFR